MKKPTLEIPDALFKRAKSAAHRGIVFRELVTEALSEEIGSPPFGKGTDSVPCPGDSKTSTAPLALVAWRTLNQVIA
jgi:hypothetical protein